MNAQTPITRATGPAWERYLTTVECLRPGGSDEEKRHRAGILLLRDIATERMQAASEPAAMVFHVIEQIAARTSFVGLSEEQLDATRMALIRLGTGARELEKVFGDHGGG